MRAKLVALASREEMKNQHALAMIQDSETL